MAESARRRFLKPMAAQAPSNETLSRLALSCSALARSGQILSTVSTSDAARNALLEAATILENDARKSGWSQIEQAAVECRSLAASTTDADLIATCRRMATTLARQASTLATEVQQQTRKPPKPATQPAAPALAPDPAGLPSAPISPSASPRATPPVHRTEEPVPSARESVEARWTVKDSDVARVPIAVSAVEREAVMAALRAGERFAMVGADTIIDAQQDRMWFAQLGPAGSYRTALDFVAGCDRGGYRDWRMPRPDEVQQLLSGGGRAWAISNGLVATGWAEATDRTWVWTSVARWHWLRFRKLVTVVELRTSQLGAVPASIGSIRILGVRGRAD